jgi:hypothetical protein
MRQCDEIVVGHSLAALAYAYLNDAVLVNNKPEFAPFPFDFFEPTADLGLFMIDPVVYTMRTNCADKIVGHPKQDLWHRLLFTLSIAGKLPFSDKAHALRIDSETNTIKVITSGNAAVEYGYQTVRIFDDDNIQGIVPEENLEPQHFKVLDWFDVKTGCCHEYDYLYGDESCLAQEIYFYASERFAARNHSYKDLVVVSRLSRSQLSDINYSDVAVRFKVLQMMKSLGLRGARNGRDQKNPDKYKYYAVRIKPAHREVLPIKQNKYFDTDNIIFDSRKIEEVILEHTSKANQCYKMLGGLARK